MSRPVREIFLDEAGYTGPDLVNRDQPVFVLASTDLVAEEARELLAASFGATRQSEIKHSRLMRSRAGRRQVLDFVRRLDPESGRAVFFAAHKEWTLLAYLLDFWLEPMMFRDGVNYYERGQNIAHTNVCYIVLGTALGADGRRELLRRFQVMTNDRTPFAYDSFWNVMRTAVRQHHLVEQSVDLLLFAEQELGWRHLLDLPAGMLDLCDYGLMQTIGFWRAKHPDVDFNLIHDRSRMIEKNRDRWEAIFDPTNPPATVGQDRRTVEFPLPIRGLQLQDSQTFPQLQVADVIAGAANALMKARALNVTDEYASQLQELNLIRAVGGGNWPTAGISPEALETEGPALRDAADFMGDLIARRKTE